MLYGNLHGEEIGLATIPGYHIIEVRVEYAGCTKAQRHCSAYSTCMIFVILTLLETASIFLSSYKVTPLPLVAKLSDVLLLAGVAGAKVVEATNCQFMYIGRGHTVYCSLFKALSISLSGLSFTKVQPSPVFCVFRV